MSKTYTRVFSQIENKAPNGHLIANVKNRKSLEIADKEIKKMLRGAK